MRLTEYLVENHDPQQLLLCLPAVFATSYSTRILGVSTEQPLKPLWRLPFLYADPAYSLDKIRAYTDRSYVQKPGDVFIAETGEYNKTRRDAEAIGNMEDYLEAYPEFVGATYWYPRPQYIDECVEAIAQIAEMCESRGIELIIAAPPMSAEALPAFRLEDMQEFYSKVTEISGFWNFIASPISADPRFFYDRTHFRNNVGEMMMARMYGDESIYIPEGFGTWVTQANVMAEIENTFTAEIPFEPENYTARLPVLAYHDLTEESTKGTEISISRFREQMEALKEAGYTPVSLEQILDYVLLGHDLPERPILITFDDGYVSNYTEAFPILQEYGYKATIFVIGVSFGKDTYKDTGEEITPHFGHEEALIMAQSGLISIQSHSYDMHHAFQFDDPFRQGTLMMDGESEQDYLSLFRRDHKMMSDLLESYGDVVAFSYPYGRVSTIASILLRELGYQITFHGNPGVSTLIKGMPQSLLELRRYYMTEDISGERMIRIISQ